MALISQIRRKISYSLLVSLYINNIKGTLKCAVNLNVILKIHEDCESSFFVIKILFILRFSELIIMVRKTPV